jgi:amino acid adenylation domain-containing protein
MIVDQLHKSFATHKDLPALAVVGIEVSYGDLWEIASRIAEDHLQNLPPGPVGVLGARELTMYVGILASVIAERAYVPLHTKFPPSRLAEMLEVSACSGILYDEVNTERLDAALREASISPSPSVALSNLPSGTVSLLSLPAQSTSTKAEDHQSLAYILFTSGSTGRPKGIGISKSNLTSYLDHATRHYGLEAGDRASQMFDLSFDLSVHDLFVTWLGGGCLCVPTGPDMLAPARFILNQRLTHWFSVPSTVSLLSRLRVLRPGTFPGIKQSLFCGEALPASLAQQWQEAAPNSRLWNLYGPTEATIAITAHEWRYEDKEGSELPVVPIGTIFPDHRYEIVTDFLPVKSGESGELWLSGPQVAQGYLADPEKTAVAFVQLPGDPDNRVWYRTGDLVRQDSSGALLYLGRLDSQIQLHGHRVELGEVEAALRQVSEGKASAAVAWPRSAVSVEGIVGFVEGIGTADDAKRLCSELGTILPAYMIPSRILFVASMPLNSNGKTDRNALVSLIQ